MEKTSHLITRVCPSLSVKPITFRLGSLLKLVESLWIGLIKKLQWVTQINNLTSRTQTRWYETSKRPFVSVVIFIRHLPWRRPIYNRRDKETPNSSRRTSRIPDTTPCPESTSSHGSLNSNLISQDTSNIKVGNRSEGLTEPSSLPSHFCMQRSYLR